MADSCRVSVSLLQAMCAWVCLCEPSQRRGEGGPVKRARVFAFPRPRVEFAPRSKEAGEDAY